jgi:phosphoribosylformylglycinamidine synthase
MSVDVLILRTAGTNCDEETDFAFRLAGARTEKLHINVLREDPGRLSEFQVMVLPGGFSYGDDLGAGKVLANELLASLRTAVDQFLGAGKLIVGICNGFQVLVKTGLLPGLSRWQQEATLTFNDSHKFEDRWTYLLATASNSPLFDDGDQFYLPVAHAEGKFVARDESVLRQMKENGQIVLRYTNRDGVSAGYPWNPNGSIDDVAAICDPTGRVLGMMPHPERHCLPVQDPRWPRKGLEQEGEGLSIFRRAVEYVAGVAGTGL